MTEFEFEQTAQQSRLDDHPVEPPRVLEHPLPFSERRLVLTLLDLLALNGALLLALALRPEYDLTWGLVTANPFWFLILSALWLPLAYTFEAYSLQVAGRFLASLKAVIQAGVITAGLYLLIPYFTPLLPPSRIYIFIFILLVLLLLSLGRALYSLAFSQEVFFHRALIVGAGEAGDTIARLLGEHCKNTYRVVGFVDDDPTKRAARFNAHSVAPNTSDGTALSLSKYSSWNVLGESHELVELISRYRVNSLILAASGGVSGELLQHLVDCLELDVEIQFMPLLYEQITGRVPVEHVGGHWPVAIPIHHPGTGNLLRLTKRIFDLLSASAGALCLALAFPFIAAAIYLDSPGPIFYTQERVGKGGKTFRVYKFRSMRPDAENGRAIWATENDQRVTRVGKLLRKTHIDEFPQFINILKGEMSAVGPRPERPDFVERLAREIPFYRLRHAIKPGMAGWGLVKQGYGSSKEDALLKLQYDLYYIKHQSLGLDLVILLKTFLDTLTFGGR